MFELGDFLEIMNHVPANTMAGPFSGYLVTRSLSCDRIHHDGTEVRISTGPCRSVQVLVRGAIVPPSPYHDELCNNVIKGCKDAIKKHLGITEDRRVQEEYEVFQGIAKSIYGLLRPYCEQTEVYLGKGADVKVHLTDSGATALFLDGEPFYINEHSFVELKAILKDVFDGYVTRRAMLMERYTSLATEANRPA